MKMDYKVSAIIEIPIGSSYKYEVDKERGYLVLDRPLNAPIPYNYGYIPKTLHDDGDPLDVCVIGVNPITPLARVKVVLLGAFLCEDNGFSDHKLVGFVEGENLDYTEFHINQVKEYLSCYKSGFVVKSFVGPEEAFKIFEGDKYAYDNQ
jgi:inorganic pyrophosphatase